MLGDHDAPPVTPPARDRVAALDTDSPPTIVSISDIHGHIGAARNALLTLSKHPDYDPIVEPDPMLRLQWVGGEDYVLVFNGDLIDRGAHNDKVVEMVVRLIEQAPPGHVRVTLGNHEMGVLTPGAFGWSDWYSATRGPDGRRAFVEQILDGHVVAAYDGYNVTYAHAGRRSPYDVRTLNDNLVVAAEKLSGVIGTPEDGEMQERIIIEYPDVLGVDGPTGRGPEAGIAWLDFEHMLPDAPPQVVGHTKHDVPTQHGNVICQNIIRLNRRNDGGEGIVVETPEAVCALCCGPEESVEKHEFTVPNRAGHPP